MKKLTVTRIPPANNASGRIVFQGSWDEDAGMVLSKLGAELTGGYELDMAGVTAVNSFGVTGWIQFLKATKNKARLRYVRCSVAVCTSLQMIPGLLAGVSLGSFFVYSECPYCGTHKQILIDASQAKDFPNIGCSSCGKVVVIPDAEEMAILVDNLEP